jgi:hypothetical protein
MIVWQIAGIVHSCHCPGRASASERWRVVWREEWDNKGDFMWWLLVGIDCESG